MPKTKVAPPPWLRHHRSDRTVELVRIPIFPVWMIAAISLTVHLGAMLTPAIDLRVWVGLGVVLSAGIRRHPGAQQLMALASAALIPVTISHGLPGAELVEHIDARYGAQMIWLIPVFVAEVRLAGWYASRTTRTSKTWHVPVPRVPSWRPSGTASAPTKTTEAIQATSKGEGS
jgi:hypothetical protein